MFEARCPLIQSRRRRQITDDRHRLADQKRVRIDNQRHSFDRRSTKSRYPIGSRNHQLGAYIKFRASRVAEVGSVLNRLDCARSERRRQSPRTESFCRRSDSQLACLLVRLRGWKARTSECVASSVLRSEIANYPLHYRFRQLTDSVRA